MRLINIAFNNRGVTTPTIEGNLQDEVTAIIEFEQENVTFASEINNLILTPDPYLIGTTDNVNVIFTQQSDGFIYLRLGDIIELQNTGVDAGVWLVKQIFDTQTIRVERIGGGSTVLQSVSYGEPSTPNTRAICGLATDLSSIKYQYNIVSKTEPSTFNSLNGGNIQYTCGCILNTTVPMVAVSDISQMQGVATCEWYQLANTYVNRYRITHTFRIFEFYKDLYFDKLSNNLPLEDWQDGYRFVFKIEQKRPTENTYRDENLIYEEDGNLGGYNENFSSLQNYFSVDSIEYRNGLEVVPSLEINKLNDIKIRLSSDKSISASTNSFEVSFICVQDDISLINDSSQTYLQNRGFAYANESLVFQSGIDYSVFSSPIVITNINSNTVEISTSIQLGIGVKNNVNNSVNKRYMLFVTCENDTGERIASRTLVDANVFFESLPDIELITSIFSFSLNPSPEKNNYIYEQPQTPDLFMTDDVVANISFYTEKAFEVDLQRIDVEVLAIDGLEEVLLDKQSANTNTFSQSPIGGKDISVSIDRGYKTDNRRVFEIKRQPSIDTPTQYGYYILFPFWVGWEYWKKAISGTIPSSLYSQNSPTKGIPNNWYYYVQQGFVPTLRIRYVFVYNNKTYEQKVDYVFNVNEYGSGDWVSESIKSYDTTGNEIINSGIKYINGQTRIEATFDRALSPAVTDLEAYFVIEDFEVTGSARKTMSVRDNNFKIIENCTIAKAGSIITVSGIVNSADLTAGKKTIYCRLFEKITPNTPIIGIATSSSLELITDNNNNAIIES